MHTNTELEERKLRILYNERTMTRRTKGVIDAKEIKPYM
jgi:hypothetical protein